MNSAIEQEKFSHPNVEVFFSEKGDQLAKLTDTYSFSAREEGNFALLFPTNLNFTEKKR